ncbi:MAG: septum formation initiator family protein [Parcubacteria group bacterium]
MQRRGYRKMLEKLALAASAAVIILLAAGIAREYSARRALDRQIAELTEELSQLNKRNTGFLRSIQAFQSGFFIEDQARMKLNLVKPGEKVAVIPSAPLKNEAPGAAGAVESADSPSSAWRNAGFWWQYFFGSRMENPTKKS